MTLKLRPEGPGGITSEQNKKEVLRHRKYQGPEVDKHLVISGIQRSSAGLGRRE